MEVWVCSRLRRGPRLDNCIDLVAAGCKAHRPGFEGAVADFLRVHDVGLVDFLLILEVDEVFWRAVVDAKAGFKEDPVVFSEIFRAVPNFVLNGRQSLVSDGAAVFCELEEPELWPNCCHVNLLFSVTALHRGELIKITNGDDAASTK